MTGVDTNILVKTQTISPPLTDFIRRSTGLSKCVVKNHENPSSQDLYYSSAIRFIISRSPTGVGNRASRTFCRSCGPVHPHGCGEQCPEDNDHGISFGSSPRVWGTDDVAIYAGDISRFIPTGVGNRRQCLVGRTVRPVHPHGCGEQFLPCPKCFCVCGSSPRVWGTELILKVFS